MTGKITFASENAHPTYNGLNNGFNKWIGAFICPIYTIYTYICGISVAQLPLGLQSKDLGQHS